MSIPKFAENMMKQLEKAGFEAYLVGGCVRDLLLKKEPKDWDITTNALPEQVLKIFAKGKYENDFGTVIVPVEKGQAVEITTYRSEQGYSDRRRPDEVRFEDKLDKDLERRDFTINAMAMDLKGNMVDLFGGEKDIKKKIIRAVGEPVDRFKEDALRMMRAIRLSSELGFEIEDKTFRGIKKMAFSIKFIANERIKDELIKILSSDRYYEGMEMLCQSNLLQYIIPELLLGQDVKQDRHHVYNVFKHSLLSLKYCPSKEWQVRLASLLHDIGKPKTKKIINGISTFYNHEYMGEKITRKIVTRLRFSNEDADRVVNLVRNHMFYYNVDEVTAASVRRLICKVGKDNLKDLIDIRIADRLGSGVKKAKPYKLRHLEYMFKRVQNDPVSVKSLKINGSDLISLLKIQPGPKIGAILDVLLAEVLNDPKMNNRKYLEERAKEVNKIDLAVLRQQAKDRIKKEREAEDAVMKKEFWVE